MTSNDPNLNEATLAFAKIGDAEVVALAGALKVNKILDDLYLMNNDIGDVGAIALANALTINASVKSIDLGCNQIGDVGAIAIANALTVNTSVELIRLGSNKIGDDGIAALANVLFAYPFIKHISLGDNQIRDVEAIALANALAKNRSVTYIDVDSEKIGVTGARALANALKENQVLTGIDTYAQEIEDNDEIKKYQKLFDIYTKMYEYAKRNVKIAQGEFNDLDIKDLKNLFKRNGFTHVFLRESDKNLYDSIVTNNNGQFLNDIEMIVGGLLYEIKMVQSPIPYELISKYSHSKNNSEELISTEKFYSSKPEYRAKNLFRSDEKSSEVRQLYLYVILCSSYNVKITNIIQLSENLVLSEDEHEVRGQMIREYEKIISSNLYTTLCAEGDKLLTQAKEIKEKDAQTKHLQEMLEATKELLYDSQAEDKIEK